MEREVDNANPTILSAAQLPTRRKKGGVAFKGPESKYEEIVNYKPSYLFPPYSAPGAWTFDEEHCTGSVSSPAALPAAFSRNGHRHVDEP